MANNDTDTTAHAAIDDRTATGAATAIGEASRADSRADGRSSLCEAPVSSQGHSGPVPCPACNSPLAIGPDGTTYHLRVERDYVTRAAMYRARVADMLVSSLSLTLAHRRCAPLPVERMYRAYLWNVTAWEPVPTCRAVFTASVGVRVAFGSAPATARPAADLSADAATDAQRHAARAASAHWNVPMRVTDFSRGPRNGQDVRLVPRMTPTEYRQSLAWLDDD